MEVDEVIKLNKELDSELNRLIKQFEDKTNVRVSHVECIDISNATDLNGPNIIVETILSWK